MEIEEVAAHNAEVYNPGSMSTQKRRREKAQEQLRNRMKRRNNGTSSSMVSTRLRNSQRDKGESTLVTGVKPVWDNIKHNSHDEWSDQASRYSNLAHPDRAVGDKRGRHGEVPLSELVGRVVQRRDYATANSSPMTIRALKPPPPPYAIQQQAFIRKMVHVQPINKRKPTSGGPYVVVLNRNSSTKKSDQTEPGEPRELPPLKQHHNAGDMEIGTWRPELSTSHEPYVHPNAEDHAVTNYRLQMQQALRIAELRCDFSTSSKPMHKHAPLPAIQVAYEVADKQEVAENVEGKTEAEVAANLPVAGKQPVSDTTKNLANASHEKANRFTSSQEVLQQMQARKQAKRRKTKRDDFNNPLRTRNRFTAKMRLFKEDLQKARELSIIQEDQSSISDRLSRLSAGRTSVASFRSLSSLKRIEESEVPGYERTDRLSEKQAGIVKTKQGNKNTDSPATADNAGLHPDETVSSGSTRISSDADPTNGVSNSSNMPCPLCVNVSTDGSISDSTIENATDTSPSNSEEQTFEDQNGMQKPASVVTTENGDHSSECNTGKVFPENDPETASGVGDGANLTSSHDVAIDFDDSIKRTSPTKVDHSTNTASPSQFPVTESLESGGSEPATKLEEESRVVMETRLAINKKSVDPYDKADSRRGIAAKTFDMRDVILPAETVQ